MSPDTPPTTLAFTTVAEYIAQFPPEVRDRLQRLRAVILSAAPDAQEGIAYRMPAYKLHGPLIYFAAFAQHIGLYPAGADLTDALPTTAAYRTGKGTLQFPHDQPLPLELITQIVALRDQDNLARKAVTHKTKS